MNWDIDDVAQALSASLPQGSWENAVSLPLYDRSSGIGVGVDGLGAGALVLPGQESLVSFETAALKFDPWCDTTWVEGGLALPKSAVLRCRFDRGNAHLVGLVAGLLVSLVDLQIRFGDAGKAIWTLRELFGEGFHTEPDQSAVRGLLGELLIIKSSPNRALAVETWHVDADDRYDFSAHASRLEVKTTTSAVREHKFNSRQLPPLHGLDVWVASVQLAEVAIGGNVASIFAELAAQLPMALSRKLADVIVETVNLPPSAVNTPQIDVQTSIAAIRLFPASAVPTPAAVPGSSDIRWTAYLDEANGFPDLNLAPIFRQVTGLEAATKDRPGTDS